MFSINDLKVINVSAHNLPPELAGWNDYGVILVDTCTRKTYIGQETDFADFPKILKPGVKEAKMEREQAYAFLLRLKSGLDSPKLGEKNIDGQFNRDCDAFAERCPDKSADMARFMSLLTADNRYIRANFIDRLQKATIETASVLLADVKKGDSAILIGKIGKNDKVSQITLDTAYALGKVSTLYITAPERDDVATLEHYFKTADVRKRIPITTKVVFIPFSDMGEKIASGAHVFIDQPMGDNAYNEGYIISAWKGARVEGFKMVHLRGCPALSGGSTKQWLNAEIPCYFGPETVRERKVKMDQDNIDLIEKAELAIQQVAVARGEGLTTYAHKILTGGNKGNPPPEPS